MKRILVAVDTTANDAAFVVGQAVELARAVGAKIRLFHAVPMPAQVPPPGMFVPPPVMHVKEMVDAARACLAALARMVPDELRDGEEVQIGPAADRVCAVVKNYDPDLVVIGAHKHGLLARALGTTASRVVNGIDRPVFVVRPLPASHTVAA